MMRILQIFRRYVIGLSVLVIVLLVVRYAMAKYRRPGSSTVLEATSMDMTTMVAAPGTVPVAVETVKAGEFAPTVTYTGSVLALNDEEVFPRVTGTLETLSVYPGDRVRAGQVIGRLDSVELTSRINESAYARIAAQNDVGISEEERRQAQAQQRSTEGKVHSLQGMMRDVQSQLTSAGAMQEQSEHELEAAQSSLADAEANSAAMQADVDYWNNEIAREERLYKARAVSTDEYQRELSQAKTAQAKVTQAEAGIQEKRAMLSAGKAKIREATAAISGAQGRLDQVRADIRSAQADVTASSAGVNAGSRRIRQRSAMAEQAAAQERTASIVRDYTELRAAQDGVVTERLVSPGTLVQPGTAVLRIKNTDRLRLQANVAETDISGILVGNAVTVTTESDPNFRLQTRVTSVFSAANPQSRTVVIEALVPNPDKRLLPGQYVVMQIATAAARRIVTVLQTAIRRDVDQKPYVWLAAAGGPGGKLIAHRIPVTLGAADDQRVVVETGLQAGEQVIYQGEEYLKEGDGVTPTGWTAEGPRTLPEGSGQMGSMPGMDMSKGATMPGMDMSNGKSMPGTDTSKANTMPGMDMSNGKSMPGTDTSKANTMPGMKMDGKSNTHGAPAGENGSVKQRPGTDHSKMPGMGGR